MISKTKTCSRGHKYEGSNPCPVCWPKTLNQKYKNIDEYIDTFPEETKIILEKIKSTIRKIVPDAVETISYGIPTFKLHGKNLVHFAAFSDHYSFFPTSSGIENFKDELKDYKISKGTVQFPLNKSVPYDLIGKITRFRIREVEDKTK